jgi:hypothetical protein
LAQHNKNYLTKDEYTTRLSLFQTSYTLVTEHNEKNNGSQLEINQFADWAPQELHSFLTLHEDPETPE